MSRWFRFYDDALNDPKVQRLSGDTFKAWINILSLASKNDGVLVSVDDVAFALRITPAKAGSFVCELSSAGLLDQVEGGYFKPHNWDARQYKSDTSNERVAAFRKRGKKQECNVTETVTVTPNETPPEQIQNRTDKGEGDASAREPLISPEAFELSDTILKALSEDREAPEWCGFPYLTQTWISQQIPRDFIISTCANLRGKHRNYLDKAVKNGWRDKQSEPQNQRKYSNGPSAGNILPAIDNLLERVRDFDRPPDVRGIESEAPIRLLSKG